MNNDLETKARQRLMDAALSEASGASSPPFSIGIRLWPPAISLASPPLAASFATASSILVALT